MKLPKSKPSDFNQFRLSGNNAYGSLGIGQATEFPFGSKECESLKAITAFTNKKVFSIATGDYHTIVIASGCNCIDTIEGSTGQCKG
jgi:hypothetical protein